MLEVLITILFLKNPSKYGINHNFYAVGLNANLIPYVGRRRFDD